MPEYDVSKEKGSNRYYVHPVNDPRNPVTGLYSTKKKALRVAADYSGLGYKDYMRLRRKERQND